MSSHRARNIYDIPEHDRGLLTVLRLVFGTAMAAAIVLAFLAIRRRDVRTHRRWMIRGYAIGLGAGTQVLTVLPAAALPGDLSKLGYALAMGAGWLLNLAVAEVVIRRSSRPSAPRRDTAFSPEAAVL